MAFKMFDKNKDGYIDAKELKVVTTTLGQRLTNEEVEITSKNFHPLLMFRHNTLECLSLEKHVYHSQMFTCVKIHGLIVS